MEINMENKMSKKCCFCGDSVPNTKCKNNFRRLVHLNKNDPYPLCCDKCDGPATGPPPPLVCEFTNNIPLLGREFTINLTGEESRRLLKGAAGLSIKREDAPRQT